MKFRSLKSLIYNLGFGLATASLLQACHDRFETVNISTMSASIISDDKATMDKNETPVYPGVLRSLEEYIKGHISYPPAAMIHRVQGTVYVQFTINEDGSLTDVDILGQKIGYGLEEESIRVVNNIPERILVDLRRSKSKRILPIVYMISEERNNLSMKTAFLKI